MAREDVLSWREGKRVDLLIIFAKCPVGKNEKILEQLSKQDGILVKDFVWWEEREQIGFARFENRFGK